MILCACIPRLGCGIKVTTDLGVGKVMTDRHGLRAWRDFFGFANIRSRSDDAPIHCAAQRDALRIQTGQSFGDDDRE